jgi:hypothetical protein
LKSCCKGICLIFVGMLSKKMIIWILIFGVTIPSDISSPFFTIIPNVLKHYKHHLAEHERISFTAFLIEHLTEKNHTDPHPEHQDSPFSHHHSSSYGFMLYSVIPYSVILSLKSSRIIIFKIKILFSQSFYHTIFEPSIWQPPQV